MDHKIRKNKKAYTFYDMYKECPIDVPYDVYKRILDTMCTIIAEKVLEGSDGFKMPYGLGFIQVGKYKPKNYDEKSLSADGYKFRLHWSKVPQTFPDRYKYQLNLVRANKRHLAQLIFNKHDYVDINDIQLYKV